MTAKDRYKNKYTPECCDTLLKGMEKGLCDYQIAAKIGISFPTFLKWKEEYSDFREAYEIGDPKRFSFLMEKADKIFLEGEAGPNDKGYKHWLKKMNYMYKDYSPEAKIQGNTTNIQINNIKALGEKSDGELLEILQQKLSALRVEKPLQIEAKIIGENDDV